MFFFHLHQCNATTGNSKISSRSSSNTSTTTTTTNLEKQFDYKIAGIYFCFATIIEIMSEPCMIHCLRTFNVTLRAKAEGIASIGKAFTTVLLLSLLQNQGDEEEQKQQQYHDIGNENGFMIRQ